MRKGTKKDELESRILNLLAIEQQVTVRLIADKVAIANDETGRKAIRRALSSLEKKNFVVQKGSGRSRYYVLSEQTGDADDLTGEVKFSAESKALAKYISQDVRVRIPVGYNRNFLQSYKPNRTYYLSKTQRDELHKLGLVEMTERPAGTYARNILNRLLIDLSWNSSRLEGNTYSLLETKRLIELGETAEGKDALEAQMILNHKSAIEYIVESEQEEPLTSHSICSIHALLSENLLGDPSASGRLRSIIVQISGSAYVPIENPMLLKECFDLFVERFNAIRDPFEQSLFAIVHLSYLQAFEDVNKRTARLVANVPFVKANLKPLSFAEVEPDSYVTALLGVYEKNDISLIRDLYIWAYRRSAQRYTAIQQSMGEPNLLKLRYRSVIQEIVRTIILEKIAGPDVVNKIKELIAANDIPEPDRESVFSLIETEIISLHEGNIARFKVLPSEFEQWQALQ